MLFIKASKNFGKLAEQVKVDSKDLAYTGSFWKWTKTVGQDETSATLMRSYNTEEDKAHSIKARRDTAGLIRGPNYIWLRGRIGPPDGAIMVAIATPAPFEQDSAKLKSNPESSEGGSKEAGLAYTLQQDPEVVFKELDQETPQRLEPGDIVQLDAEEELRVKRGGVGLIIMVYQVKVASKPEKGNR